VARQRRARLRVQPTLLFALAEAASAPAGVEQIEHLGERLRTVGVEALEDLMDGDPEALVERLLGRDPQHACELVAQRTAAICLDVRGRQRQADSLARQERPER